MTTSRKGGKSKAQGQLEASHVEGAISSELYTCEWAKVAARTKRDNEYRCPPPLRIDDDEDYDFDYGNDDDCQGDTHGEVGINYLKIKKNTQQEL